MVLARTAPFLPTVAEDDIIFVQKRQRGQLSLVNNKLTELHPNAEPFVQEPMSCPTLGHTQKVFDSWPTKSVDFNPKGFLREHEKSVDCSVQSDFPFESKVLHEEVDTEKVRRELADLMIDEDGEIVRISDCSSECESEDEFANIYEVIASSSADETSFSSSEEEEPAKPIELTPPPTNDSEKASNWKTVTRRNSRRPLSANATLMATPKSTPRKTLSSKNPRSRRSKSKPLFCFPSSNSPYTPFPTPVITPKASDDAPLSPNQSSPPLVPAPYITTPPASKTRGNTNGDDVAQLRSLHNLARLGSYEDFEVAMMDWVAVRSTNHNNTTDLILDVESQYILKYLDL